MKKKKKHQKKTKKQGISFHRLAKITSRSLSKAYQGFKNKQKNKKLKKSNLKKEKKPEELQEKKKNSN